MYEFDWSSIPGSLPFLWDGMKISLEITLTAVVFGIVWGTLLAMMRLSSVKALSWFAAGYVNLFRAVPLVMVLLWFFLIVPRFVESLLDFPPGSDLRLSSAMMGFALFEAAYYSEIIRADIQSVPNRRRMIQVNAHIFFIFYGDWLVHLRCNAGGPPALHDCVLWSRGDAVPASPPPIAIPSRRPYLIGYNNQPKGAAP